VTRDAPARIERFQPRVNAIILIDADRALAAARASEARWAKGEPQVSSTDLRGDALVLRAARAYESLCPFPTLAAPN